MNKPFVTISALLLALSFSYQAVAGTCQGQPKTEEEWLDRSDIVFEGVAKKLEDVVGDPSKYFTTYEILRPIKGELADTIQILSDKNEWSTGPFTSVRVSAPALKLQEGKTYRVHAMQRKDGIYTSYYNGCGTVIGLPDAKAKP